MDFFFEDYNITFVNFFLIGLTYIITWFIENREYGEASPGFPATTIRRVLLYIFWGALGAAVLVAWAMIALDNIKIIQPMDYIRVYMTALMFISILSFFPLIFILGYVIYIYQKVELVEKFFKKIPLPLNYKSFLGRPKRDRPAPVPDPPGTAYAQFSILVGLVIYTFGAYMYYQVRISSFGDGLGLMGPMFGYPIGLFMMFLGIIFLRDKAEALIFIGCLFGSYSLVHLWAVNFSSMALPFSASTVGSSLWYMEWIHPLLCVIFLNLGLRLKVKKDRMDKI